VLDEVLDVAVIGVPSERTGEVPKGVHSSLLLSFPFSLD
jgi:acyl-CoA synthetase (AMP-forming)/AMP-acid ligase II